MDGNAPFQGHEPRGLPSNIEAEQALLGALLINNDVWSHVSGSLRAEHFYDAVHARIYAAAGQHIDADRLANATTLKALMEDDAGLQEIGGSRYLARLAGAAISVKSAPAYACEIIEAWRRRQVIAAAEALSEAARTGDVSEHVQAAEDAFAEAVTDADARKVAYSGIEAITDALHAVNEVYQGEAPPITPTGFGGFDSHTGGLRAGDLVLLGARPSMGKSAVLVEVMRRAASSGVPVVFVSGEMSPASLMLRAISAEVSGERQIQYARAMRENAMSEADMRAFIEGARRLDHNASGLISIIDAPAPRISLVESETRRALRRLRTRAGESARPPIVIVDYVQIVQGSDPKASQIARVSEVSIRLKALAKREGAAVIAAAQLNRAVEQRQDKRPMLSDLRDTGQLEQDADIVAFLYREEYYLQAAKPAETDPVAIMAWQEAVAVARGRIDIIVAKQRNGALGTVEMRHDLPTNRFWEAGVE